MHKPTPAELAHRAKDETRDAGYERAALFLLLIDTNDAASVLVSLDDKEVIQICRIITRLGEIDANDARRIVQEFGVSSSVIRTSAHGGPKAARRLLTAAYDRHRAHRLFDRITSSSHQSL